MQNALQKIGFIIGKIIREGPLPDTVIGRFMEEKNSFAKTNHIVINIIGAIQAWWTMS